MRATNKNRREERAIAYAFISTVLIPLTVASAWADSSGAPLSRSHVETKSIAYIRSGGPGCFGVLISPQLILSPKAACQFLGMTIGTKVDMTFPLISSLLGTLNSTLVEESSQNGYYLFLLRKMLSPVTIESMGLIIDIGDDLYAQGILRGIWLPNENRFPLGTDCSADRNGSAGGPPHFRCDDSNAAAIFAEDRGSLVAIHTKDNEYTTVRDIIETSPYLSKLDKRKARIATIDESVGRASGNNMRGNPASPPDADVTVADSDFVSDDDVSKLYSESKAMIIAADTYKFGTVWAPLPVSDDAAQLKVVLERQGFSVELYPNPESDKLYSRIKTFLDSATDPAKTRMLVYFMGHGWTDEKHNGYIVPVDAPDPNLERKSFNSKALSMIEVASLVKQTNVLHTLIVLDSCFSGTVFLARSPSAPLPKLTIAEAMRPVREFITAGNETQKSPAKSVFTPTFIRGIQGDADPGSKVIGAAKLGLWLQSQIAPAGVQTPREGPILDPEFNAGDFLFIPVRSR